MASVALTCDGKPVDLGVTEPLPTPAVVEFDVTPGHYRARVSDAQTGGMDAVSAQVDVPGQLKSYGRELKLLGAGERLDLDSADAMTLRVLPAVKAPLDTLVEVTASYAHLCCEHSCWIVHCL